MNERRVVSNVPAAAQAAARITFSMTSPICS